MVASIQTPVQRGAGNELPTAVVVVGADGATGQQSQANSQSVVPASGARFMLANAQGASAGSATYRASGTGYTAYATPTDMLVITGSATKTVIVTGFWVQFQSTAAAAALLYFIKRSAANTGGTSTNPAAVPVDSANAAATAALSLYTAAPALGASAGTVSILGLTTSATTIYPAPLGIGGGSNSNPALAFANSAADLHQGITLRGVAESLAINFNGAALPAGSTITWGAEWIEI